MSSTLVRLPARLADWRSAADRRRGVATDRPVCGTAVVPAMRGTGLSSLGQAPRPFAPVAPAGYRTHIAAQHSQGPPSRGAPV